MLCDESNIPLSPPSQPKAPCLADVCELFNCCRDAEEERGAELGDDGEVLPGRGATLHHAEGDLTPARRGSLPTDVAAVARCRGVVERCWEGGEGSPPLSDFAARLCMGLQEAGGDARVAVGGGWGEWWGGWGPYILWAALVGLAGCIGMCVVVACDVPPPPGRRRVKGLPGWGVPRRIARFVRGLRPPPPRTTEPQPTSSEAGEGRRRRLAQHEGRDEPGEWSQEAPQPVHAPRVPDVTDPPVDVAPVG